MHNKIIGVWEDGELDWHLRNTGPTDHVTLCGLDGHDDSIGQALEQNVPKGTKVTCKSCYKFYEGLKRMKVRESNFTASAKR